MNFRETLNFYKEQKKVSDKVIADAVGLSRLAVTNLRSGKNGPTLKTAAKILAYLGVDGEAALQVLRYEAKDSVDTVESLVAEAERAVTSNVVVVKETVESVKSKPSLKDFLS